MHTYSTRANAIFCYGIFICFVLAGMNAMTRPYLQGEPTGRVSLMRVDKLRRHEGLRADHALVTIDLDADFRPLWTWNTKQIFAYVVAEFETKENVLNQVVIFDAILKTRGAARLSLRDAYAKYWLADQHFGLRGAEVRLTVCYDVTPVSGLLVHGCINGGSSSFELPANYITN